MREGEKPLQYHELHAIEMNSGRIVAHIRNGGDTSNGASILQTISEDGGRTWSMPEPTGVVDKVSNPSHLLRLRNGDLLMSYGDRNRPWPIKVRLSRDEGDTWSEPAVVYEGTERADMGYPSTVQVAEDRFVTVWYETPEKDRHHGFLQVARWRMVSPADGETGAKD